MGSHPINLIIRFLLELTSLVILGIWGWKQNDSWFQFILALGIPIIAAIIWGVFAVPNDPSRSGKAPIAVSGMVRLLIEFAFFTISTLALYDLGYIKLSWAIAIFVVIHYIISFDRIIWLMNR